LRRRFHPGAFHPEIQPLWGALRSAREERARLAPRHGALLQLVENASGTPVLLLTATPIQNNLAELWGLVKYVDPLGTLLGDLPTFRSVFNSADDRMLMPGQEQELRDRLRSVMQRTPRRNQSIARASVAPEWWPATPTALLDRNPARVAGSDHPQGGG
jgi:hypothetical protein